LGDGRVPKVAVVDGGRTVEIEKSGMDYWVRRIGFPSGRRRRRAKTRERVRVRFIF
jgi:hypothetical protein